MVLCMVGFVLMGGDCSVWDWRVDGVRGLPPGGFRDIETLPCRLPWWNGDILNSTLGEMDHPMQDKAGRMG